MPTVFQLTLRRTLIKAITKHVEAWGKSQQGAARKLGLSQPRLNTLLNGHADAFSLDTLVAIAAKAGLQVRVSAVRRYRTG
jgi:predicted XRE-type DNA-binding protein